MEPKEARPTRKPWEVSGLAWTAAAIAAVCFLLHSVYWHEDVGRRALRVAFFSSGGRTVTTPSYTRIGWPLPFAEGKKPDSEDGANTTQTQILRHLTGVEILPLGAAVDLLLLIVLSFSAAYATERLKEHLRPQVTITGLLGLSTLAAWEVHTAWKPSLAVDGGTQIARQVEFLLVGNGSYMARFVRFFIFIACLVAVDVTARVGRHYLWTRRGESAAKTKPPHWHSWLPWLTGAFAAVLVLWHSFQQLHQHRSEDGLRATFGFGWPLPLLEETVSRQLADSMVFSPDFATIHRYSSTEVLWLGLVIDVAIWILLTTTAIYGVRWLLKTMAWPSVPIFLAGGALYLCFDSYNRMFYYLSWLDFGLRWWETLKFLAYVYRIELLQLLIFSSCLFIPHMAFALLGKLVTGFQARSPRAEQAKTG